MRFKVCSIRAIRTSDEQGVKTLASKLKAAQVEALEEEEDGDDSDGGAGELDMLDEPAPSAPSKKGQRSSNKGRNKIAVQWLQDLVQELQPRAASEVPEAASSSAAPPDQEQSPAAAKTAEVALQDFALEAFGANAGDALEDGEAEYVEQVEVEEGLASASAFEEQKVRAAVDKQRLKGDEALAGAVDALLSEGMDPEDAVQEAMLAAALGNGVAATNTDVLSPQAAAEICEQHNVPAAFEKWQDAFLKSLAALQDRSVAIRNKEVGHAKELSLMCGCLKNPAVPGVPQEEEPRSVFFVHWKDPAAREGRPVSLDAENRVKALVATGRLRLARDYSNAQIMHPAVGVRMERQRGWKNMLRPQVPDAAMRLYSMCKAALLAQDKIHERSCFICQDASNEDSDTGSNMKHICPCCTLASHTECCERIAAYGDEHGLNLPVGTDLSVVDFSVMENDPFTAGDSSPLDYSWAFGYAVI